MAEDEASGGMDGENPPGHTGDSDAISKGIGHSRVPPLSPLSSLMMMLYVYSMLRYQGRSTELRVFMTHIRALDLSSSLGLRLMTMCIPRLRLEADDTC